MEKIEADTGNEEEKKEEDTFVIVENSYIDGVAKEVLPLSNFSDFTRVNPRTVNTDFKLKDSQVTSTFLIGP